MYSLIIKQAKVVDGTGKPAATLDVAVEGDKIVNVDTEIKTAATTTIDGKGQILAPGFVDIQNHSDGYWQIFENPILDSLITQGFTTILMGQCGASLAPLLSRDALLSVQKWHSLEATNVNWQSFEEYLDVLSAQKFSCNIASLVGYSTLRRGILGDQVRSLEKSELESIKKVLKQSLKAGAFGLSSGLSYSHEIIISELELFELAKIIKEQEALFSIHLRNESSEIVEAVDEALDIAKNSRVNMKISHLKVKNQENWHKFGEVTEALDNAYHKGINVHFDLYPYSKVWQTLYSYLPKWAIEGGRTVMLKHFADPVQRNKILMFLNSRQTKYADIRVASTANRLSFVGKTIGQIAKNLETTSEQAILHLIQNGGSEVLVFDQSLEESQVDQLLLHPLSFISTDGAGFGLKHKNNLIHPRCFGTSANFIKKALDLGLGIEQIVKKLSSGPAKKMGLKNRGEIKPGNFADLVLFDLNELEEKATYENPYQFSKGINHVFVNGMPVVSQGQITRTLPGKILKKS